jgi:hypothetical protein
VGGPAKDFLATVGDANPLKRLTVRLKRRSKGQAFSGDYDSFETWRELDTTDETALKLATIGLRRSKWGSPVFGIGAWGSIPLGEVVFESDRGKLRVLLEPQFIFDDGPGCYDSHHQFESWTLAKLVDELLREKFGEGLKKEFFESASGEQGLHLEEEAFEKHWKVRKDSR